jgi:uncharacterized protein (TIGR00297 family)
VPGNELQRRSWHRVDGVLRKIALSPSGALAALGIGALALLAGARWVVLLLVFFGAATAVTRFRRREKLQRAGGLLDKTGPRDAAQVLANGGAFALGALLFAVTGDERWAVVAAGALAAASADTWATELGLLSSATPRSIISGAQVPPGSSGGVTLAGTAAGLLGALIVTTAVFALGWPGAAVAAGAGGLIGMTADSLLGAAAQERRWCPACASETEARVHSCGRYTTARRGMPGLNNDVVNAIATFVGAGAALLLQAWSA